MSPLRKRGPAVPALFPMIRLPLEIDLHRQLHNARVARAGHLSEGVGSAGGKRCVHSSEVGFIERIERFKAELRADALGQPNVLEQREIELAVAGTDDNAASG